MMVKSLQNTSYVREKEFSQNVISSTREILNDNFDSYSTKTKKNMKRELTELNMNVFSIIIKNAYKK